MAEIVDQSIVESERVYLEFFDDTEEYKDLISSLIDKENLRLIVNINDIRKRYPDRALKLLNNCFPEVIACQRALKKCIQNLNPEFGKQYDEFFVGFEGSFGSNHVTPRTLSSHNLGNMVCVEGIVTKCSIVRPKVVRSVHFCPTTKKTIERRYTDMTSLDAFPSSGAYPTKDEDGNLLETEFGLSTYKDHQTLTIQEMPESAPAGQLPRSVDIIADSDLVDKCKPGDRVQVVGQYRCLPGKKGGYTSATFRTVLIANNVQPLSKDAGPVFSDKDVGVLREMSKREDIVDILSRSLAPSIHGHEYIKRALLCLLMGGVERLLNNGSRIRGDINIMLIGDPSVAKSQFLRFVLYTAHRAIATTGRGSSGVGLTAAVTTDLETGERQLEAGAMVLADRGIVCIDEFDKMSDIDRTAIHEVMEQGRVTIAKAGIQAKLNARCSVLAAANPVYGRYDQYKSPMENIGLQDSLLSRFDLLFIVLDKMDPESDRAIAEHVLRMHRFRTAGEPEGAALPLQANDHLLSTGDPNADEAAGQDQADLDEDTGRRRKAEDDVFEKHNRLLHGRTRGADQQSQYFTLKFLQKYIHVARQMKPKLSKEAADLIAEKYCDLRSHEQAEGGDNMKRTQPITARSLETLIRISTAHAKARMSKTVTRDDAEAAAELISYAIFKEVLEKIRRGKRHRSGSESSSDDSDDGMDKPRRKRKSLAPEAAPERASRRQMGQDAEEMETLEEADEGSQRRRRRSGAVAEEPAAVQLSAEKLALLGPLVSRAFQERHIEMLPIEEVLSFVRGQNASLKENEIRAGLQQMHDDNRIMLTSTDVWLI